VFDDADLQPGVHVNGIGSYTPEMQEIPAETVIRARIVVDSRSAVLEEAGDLIIPMQEGLLAGDPIYGEIGEVAAGRIPGRESDEEVTVFKSVGVAVQDVAVAKLVLRRAVELDIGVEANL
jgi:ornithine cyclodeaminase/alanine dehydrogenase-like protein (mu-crystallin family)